MQLDLFGQEEPDNDTCNTLLCRKCNTYKPFSSFNPCAVEWETQKRTKGIRGVTGTARYCKECRDEYARTTAVAKKTAPPRPTEDYACDICETITPASKLHLDHNHNTGKFRGWLCRTCNTGLGSLGDSQIGLQKAIDYLRRTEHEQP